MYKIAVVLLVLAPSLLNAQSFMGEQVDSVWILVYNGCAKKGPKPRPVPISTIKADPISYLEGRREYYRDRYQRLDGIDSEMDMGSYSQLSVEVRKKGMRFNPTIIWASKKTFIPNGLRGLEPILRGESALKVDSFGVPQPRETPSMCYCPLHSILLFRADTLVTHYDVCFRCRRTKRKWEGVGGIDYEDLRAFFKAKDVPVFDGDHPFGEYKKTHSKIDSLKMEEYVWKRVELEVKSIFSRWIKAFFKENKWFGIRVNPPAIPTRRIRQD